MQSLPLGSRSPKKTPHGDPILLVFNASLQLGFLICPDPTVTMSPARVLPNPNLTQELFAALKDLMDARAKSKLDFAFLKYFRV